MSDYLRFRRRMLRTPVHRYVHPETGRQITVIGTMHFGEPAYYAGLRALIGELEAGGAIVQCEGSGRLPYDEQDLTDDEHTVLDMEGRKKELEKRRITELGWVSQIGAMGYPSRWQVFDLGIVDIIRGVGWKRMLDSEMKQIQMFDRPDGDPRSIEQFRLLMYLAFAALRFTAWTSARRARKRRKPQSIDTVLLDQRDAIALEGLWSTEQDTVLIWGCAHLPGLAAGIRKRGYLRTGKTEWHTAAVLPPIRSILARFKAASDATPRTGPEEAATTTASTTEAAHLTTSVESATPAESTTRT